MSMPKLGSSIRMAALKAELSKRKGVRNPGALAASLGRKKASKGRNPFAAGNDHDADDK